MNFTSCMSMVVSGHADIDFVDIHVDADNRLYIDPERIALSQHPFAVSANAVIEDFFNTLCQAAEKHDYRTVYHLLSFGREPNETHLGLSVAHSQGKGTSPEIMMPIIRDMIDSGVFDNRLVTQLGDMQLWTPNFNHDRLSDLTTNIIRSVLVDYTEEQYRIWNLHRNGARHHAAPSWDTQTHEWCQREYPYSDVDGYPILLVPKSFIGRSMLSSPGELLNKYALRYRQQEHLDKRSELCHLQTKRNGIQVLKPPTRHEIYDNEVKGMPVKAYIRETGRRFPQMIRELHLDHRESGHRGNVFLSDEELDALLYRKTQLAV